MCLKNIISTVVFVFNIICFLAGVGLITIGVMYVLSFTDLTDKLPSDYDFMKNIPYLTITVGCIVTTISFFGCCGVIRQSPCLLTTYAIILLVIFIGQVALGVFAFVSINDTKDLDTKVENKISDIFQNARDNNKTGPAYAIQSDFKCCGRDGPSFWLDAIPKSCYREEKVSKDNLYTGGCVKAVRDFIKSSAKVIGIVALSLSAIEVVGGVLALCLANSARNEARRQPYH